MMRVVVRDGLSSMIDKLDVVYRSCLEGIAKYGFPLLHSLVHLALEPLKISSVARTHRYASLTLPPYFSYHSGQAFRVLLTVHYQ